MHHPGADSSKIIERPQLVKVEENPLQKRTYLVPEDGLEVLLDRFGWHILPEKQYFVAVVEISWEVFFPSDRGPHHVVSQCRRYI